jgi:hypothetical protein
MVKGEFVMVFGEAGGTRTSTKGEVRSGKEEGELRIAD